MHCNAFYTCQAPTEYLAVSVILHPERDFKVVKSAPHFSNILVSYCLSFYVFACEFVFLPITESHK